MATARVGRGLAALIAAVIVALAGGALVFGVSEASPPPGQVLTSTRHYLSRPRSLTYRVTEAVTEPSGTAGTQLVQHRQVSGTEGGGTDFVVTVAGQATEYRTVVGDAGVWVRTATAPDLVSTAWVHVDSYAAYERTAAAGTGATAVVLDQLSSGDIVAALVRAAAHPTRHGSSVRTLDVALDPAAVLGAAGTAVSSMAGQISVDAHDRPTAISLTVVTGPDSVDLRYVLTWDAPVAIAAPAAADVTSS